MKTNTGTLHKFALFGAALIWGSSFIVVKSSVDTLTPNVLLGVRFSIGCVLLCLIFHKKLRLVTPRLVLRGGLTGLFLFTAYCVQTIGITQTTPGKNAFLTAVYCVLVPFLYWLVYKIRPDRYNFIAAVLCIAGIGFVSLNGDFSIGRGDALTLLGGFFYAVHMVAVAKLGKGEDSVLFTIMQFGSAALASWVVALVFEGLPTALPPTTTIFGVLYLAVFATTVALLLQNIGQQGTDPSAAAILLSLESVFGVLFSVLLYGEELTPRLVFGFVLIFFSVLTSETKLSFLHRHRTSSTL